MSAIKFEAARVRFFSDVFVAVAVAVKLPNSYLRGIQYIIHKT